MNGQSSRIRKWWTERRARFRNVSMFLPYAHCDVHKIIPYKEGKETSIAVLKTLIELSKK